jgi:predicted acylesterase/phospholipase RssA
MVRILACMLLCVLCARPLHAQHSLVLSGGGARGLSHAGALVALEQLGYRPPLVVGTSMGAIVGALYAAGLPAAEIRDIIARENWLERFAGESLLLGPRREARRPLLSFGIGSGRVFGGFIPETGINQRLVEMLFDAGVRANNDFDALPLRYRAVAADLATGAEVVLARGDLPRAVRASMAVPGVFAPVRWNDLVLVDGGVANNMAVSVARQLSSDPVIGIDVLRPARDIEERGVLDLGVRALRLLIENARPDTGSVPDILVLPRLEPGFSETYFPADASSLIRTGYESALQQVPPTAAERDVRRAAGAPPSRITALRIDNAGTATERLVRRIMDGAVREYDAPDIVRRTHALHMTGLFQSVWPRVERTDTTAVLVVDVARIASTSVAGSARWDNDRGAGAWLLLRQHVELRTPVELRISGAFDQLGHAGTASASFFSALVPGLTWSGGAHALEQRIRVFDGDAIVSDPYSRRAGAWLGAEVHGSVGEWFISALARADHVRDPGARGWAVGPFVRFARPPATDRVVGLDPVLEADVRGGDLEYQRLLLRAGPSFRAGRLRIAPLLSAEIASAGTPLHAQPASFRDAAPWLADGQLRAPGIIAGGVDIAYPILLNGYARVRVRGLAAGAAFDDMGLRAGGEIGAVWPTVLGPVSISLAAARGARRLNIGLGTEF